MILKILYNRLSHNLIYILYLIIITKIEFILHIFIKKKNLIDVGLVVELVQLKSLNGFNEFLFNFIYRLNK